VLRHPRSKADGAVVRSRLPIGCRDSARSYTLPTRVQAVGSTIIAGSLVWRANLRARQSVLLNETLGSNSDRGPKNWVSFFSPGTAVT
jgi:hypothetical protein